MSMRQRLQPRRLHALLLAAIAVSVLALGWIIGRDLRQAPEAASQLYMRLAAGLELVDQLDFHTQEVRRILLYALHTSDANLQLEYAEQSRTAASQVERLLAAGAAARTSPSHPRTEIERVAEAWSAYVAVRDEVVGLILEGSLHEGVMLDQDRGTARFNGVRAAVAALKARLQSEAAIEVTAARRRAERATLRLLVLVAAALVAAIGAIFLVNRRAALEAVEVELRRARDAAEAATAAKSDFLATMSHELRTPLNAVIGIADLLDAEELSPRQRDLVRMLKSSATALLALVSDILDYSRIEAGLMDLKPSTWSLADCIEDAFDPVTDTCARKGLDLGYVIDPAVPAVVTADRERVGQVLLNLLANAVKFTESGEVSVHVGARPLGDERVEIHLNVRDTGPGIPAHRQEQLFKRFTQLDAGAARSHGGAGLGLAISERLSGLLGGSLRVDSTVGCGTTFTFLFLAVMDATTSAPTEVQSFEGTRVLLGAAPGIVREQLRSLMTGWGIEIVDASPNAELNQSLDACDVIIVDADASAHDEYALTRVPVIAVTRMRTPAEIDRTSALHTLLKPVRARALEEALRCALNAAPAQIATPVVATVLPFAGESVAVLLVEDNNANRRVMRMMLEELGVNEVDEAVDGIQAVARARERDYDVILMDLQMPRLDGFHAARRIRAEQRARPVIVALSANVVQGEERRCQDAGMDGYLSKPIRLGVLAAALRSYVDHQV